MTQSSGRVAGEMRWLVTRYPKAPGQLITLGAILSDPEEPETRLNRHDAKAIDEKDVIDESVAVQRTMQAGASNDHSILLKVAQPLLGAGLSVDGKLSRDRKTVVEALDVKAKVLLPDKSYMNASVESPGVQDYVRAKNFSTRLYMIVGVASARKLSIDEETSRQRWVGAGGTVAPPGALGAEVTAEVGHSSSRDAVSGLRIEEACDFAYRVREFTYWKHRKEKVKMKAHRNKGALFSGSLYNESDDDDDDDEDLETVATFNSLKGNDVAGGPNGLATVVV